ncbi:MAG TPA: erythromycin esterase family protein [Thermoanaerobaculia bacterium]|nr:erythromycin esterase family protein [Thermoanaerobaculia bacterium]
MAFLFLLAAPIDSYRTLDPLIRDARLIGVGESVHDIHEFFDFRQKLLQDLVRRHRVTALVLESGVPEAMALDDYVHGKTAAVDYNAVLPGGYGSLEDIRLTMEWIRAWNLGEGKRHPVGVYGADLPGRSGSMVPALDKLQELTAGNAEIRASIDAIRPVATQISAGWWRGAAQKYEPLSTEVKAKLTADVNQLVERVNQGDWAKRVARVVQQNELCLRLGMYHPTVPREEALAENTLWILSRLPKSERAVYWAHNAHVQRAPVKGGPIPPTASIGSGMHFAKALGKKYVAIATAYGGPAIDNGSAPESGSVDEQLSKLGSEPFLLSLRGKTQPWMNEERSMRFQIGYLLVPLGTAFDAVAYFNTATRGKRVQ